jgi:hypothetical protein
MTHREKTEAVLRIVVSKGIACYGRRNGKGGAWECNYCKACNPSLSSLEHVAGCHIGQAAALLAEMERGEVDAKVPDDTWNWKAMFENRRELHQDALARIVELSSEVMELRARLAPPPPANADNGKDGE